MSPLPKLVLDTNVCGKLLTPAYQLHLGPVKALLKQKFRLVVSAETFIELLDAIKGGDGSHFESDRDRLRLMAGDGRPSFVQFPGAFVLGKILGMRPAAAISRFGPSSFAKWFRLVLLARDRDELFRGVRVPGQRKRRLWTFDPNVISEQQASGKAAHRAFLEKVRSGTITIPGRDSWAFGIAHMLGCSINQQQAVHLGAALDAAYEYEKALGTIVARGRYNFDKHDGDWVDSQQLFYLCDREVFLLTDDAGLQQRVANSSQGDRVLLLPTFLEENGITPPQ
jgi:hypothetical protein